MKLFQASKEFSLPGKVLCAFRNERGCADGNKGAQKLYRIFDQY
jgi:hypothetical protein